MNPETEQSGLQCPPPTSDGRKESDDDDDVGFNVLTGLDHILGTKNW